MTKKRISAIEYIRAISMLGVIGIHTGSQYLGNPLNNIHLVALFEIVTRFSVPIFFFISAFGLFYNLNLDEKFNYANFMSRRFKTVLIPYLSWSFLYLLHYTLTYGDYSLWSMLSRYLFFGLSSYQLYFLVILLWFYALMPLWIFMIKHMTGVRLGVLLILQLLFDYYSSYILSPQFNSATVNLFIEYRLNYWVIHYLFIFIFGGYAAVHYEQFSIFLKKYYSQIKIFFYFSFLSLLTHYYYLIYSKNYSAESAINTAHQLSPAGIYYTIGASLFFFAIFSFAKLPRSIHSLLSVLGAHSYFIYLFHPFAIHYLSLLVAGQGKLMTAPITILFYFAVTMISLLAAFIVRRAGKTLPLINVLLIGVYPKQNKS